MSSLFHSIWRFVWANRFIILYPLIAALILVAGLLVLAEWDNIPTFHYVL